MDEINIDNKLLKGLAKQIKDIQDVIQGDIELLDNENADIFQRYMAYCRSSFYVNVMPNLMLQHRKAIRLGSDITHEIFKTKTSTEYGWDSIDLTKNPFFKSDNDSGSNIKDEMRKALARLLQNVTNH